MTNSFPWYDSIWLTKYARAKELIRQIRPEKLTEFEDALEGLKTRPDFQIKLLPRVFDDPVMENIKHTIRTLQVAQLEMHEAAHFGRFIVHDHPLFTELQKSITGLVSEAAGEPLEPSYNFLSLYTKLGVCPVHMDSPQAKWTLDVCIAQSEPWPIHLSQVQPWPVDLNWGQDWQEAIKQSPNHQFTSYALEPGQALVFSGSSQWHYREPLAIVGKEHFCQLLFFHFVPLGVSETAKPKHWPRLFGIPELSEVVAGPS